MYVDMYMYSTWMHIAFAFSNLAQFFKFLNTYNWKIISSNFIHSIRASICIRKCNRNMG
uniref:Uncharacterized protein n=1 Tax=Amphimedon queenslandica TaxID=400682 RepID=A0A1X7VT68_AMPQE